MTPLGRKIRSSAFTIRSLLLYSIISTAFNFATPYYFNVWRSAPVKVVVVSGKTHLIAEAVSVKDAQEERLWIAREAATAIFYRNPNGFPLGGTIDRICSPLIRKQVMEASHEDEQAFMNLKIDQHFEPTRPIREMPGPEGAFTMQVDGDLIRIWKQDGKDEIHTTPIRILMNLAINDDGRLLSKYPLIVTKLESHRLDEPQKLSSNR